MTLRNVWCVRWFSWILPDSLHGQDFSSHDIDYETCTGSRSMNNTSKPQKHTTPLTYCAYLSGHFKWSLQYVQCLHQSLPRELQRMTEENAEWTWWKTFPTSLISNIQSPFKFWTCMYFLYILVVLFKWFWKSNGKKKCWYTHVLGHTLRDRRSLATKQGNPMLTEVVPSNWPATSNHS